MKIKEQKVQVSDTTKAHERIDVGFIKKVKKELVKATQKIKKVRK